MSWKDRTTNEELLSSAGIEDLQDIVADRQRRFIGHVLRLPTSRPASLVIDCTPEGGSRRWGRPKRTWQDARGEDLQEMGVSGSDTHEARSIASDRAQWRPKEDQQTMEGNNGEIRFTGRPLGGPKSKSKYVHTYCLPDSIQFHDM